MAVSVVQVVHKDRIDVDEGGVGTTTVSVPSVAAGSALVFIGGAFYNGTFLSLGVTDDKSGSWQTANDYNGGSAGSLIHIKYALNVTGGTTVITLDLNGDSGGTHTIEGDVLELAGVATSSALDAVVNANPVGNSSAATAVSGTLAQNDEIIFAIMSHLGADTTLAGDGTYTAISENEDNDAGTAYNSQYKIVATSATDTADWSLGASRDWFTALASFKAAAGGGGATAAVVVRGLTTMGMGR
jgi:hypothetical protein